MPEVGVKKVAEEEVDGVRKGVVKGVKNKAGEVLERADIKGVAEGVVRGVKKVTGEDVVVKGFNRDVDGNVAKSGSSKSESSSTRSCLRKEGRGDMRESLSAYSTFSFCP